MAKLSQALDFIFQHLLLLLLLLLILLLLLVLLALLVLLVLYFCNDPLYR